MDAEARNRLWWVELFLRSANYSVVCLKFVMSRPTLRKWYGIEHRERMASRPQAESLSPRRQQRFLINTADGLKTDVLIRRHPKVFFVSFEYLARQLFKPLFQRDGRATFTRPFLRDDLQFRNDLQSRGGIRSHKQVLLSSKVGNPATLPLPTNRKNEDKLAHEPENCCETGITSLRFCNCCFRSRCLPSIDFREKPGYFYRQ
jgi:hypothetical protein